MRAFLLANATVAFDHPTLSFNCTAHLETGSSRRPAENSALRAPMTRSLRRYASPRLVIRPNRGFPPVEFIRGTKPSHWDRNIAGVFARFSQGESWQPWLCIYHR